MMDKEAYLKLIGPGKVLISKTCCAIVTIKEIVGEVVYCSYATESNDPVYDDGYVSLNDLAEWCCVNSATVENKYTENERRRVINNLEWV